MQNKTNQEKFKGKVPPQDVGTEEIILGCLMLEKDTIDFVHGKLTPECFFKPEHGKIYESIVELYKNNQPIDLLTVTKQLRTDGNLQFIGGALYLSELTSRVGSSANIEFYCLNIIELYIRRKSITDLANAIMGMYDMQKDVFTNLQEIRISSEEVDYYVDNIYSTDTMTVFKQVQTEILDSIQNNVKPILIHSGSIMWDRLNGKFEAGDFVVIAGRSGMAKTTMMISLMINKSKRGEKCLFITMEMTSKQIIRNIISNVYSIDRSQIKKGNVTMHQYQEIQEFEHYIKEGFIIVEDLPRGTEVDIKKKVRTHKKKQGITSVFVDYLQYIECSNKKQDKRNQVNQITYELKNIAKETKVVLYAGSQLNRDNEADSLKLPKIHNLKESGAIEETADVIWGLWRPDYYKPRVENREIFETYEINGEVIQTENKLFILNLKNRDGGGFNVVMDASMMYSRIEDREPETYEAEIVSYDFQESQPFTNAKLLRSEPTDGKNPLTNADIIDF